MSAERPHVILIGAGLAGSLLAVSLARRGFLVDVYERRTDMRTARISAGRSINLALSVRGIHALGEVGLADDILAIAIPMTGRAIHPRNGAVFHVPYGQSDAQHINSVSRGELNMRLLSLAEREAGVRLHFETRCTGMDLDTGEVRLRDERDGREFTVLADTVIGTDGSASAIRGAMQQRGRFNYSQQYLEHGYKELHIPPTAEGGFQLEKHALHIWPRSSYMLIGLPNLDASFTLTLFFPFEGEPSFTSLASVESARAFFADQFADALALMPTFDDDFARNPSSALVTVRCAPWHVEGRAALLGDAAHAVVPFYGQGMNASFEDVSALAACIDEHGTDWARVYADYEQRRRRNSDAIADLAIENFVEMRDLTADPHFLLMRDTGLELERRFPDMFIPKYTMVSFTRIPYAEALARGRVQDRILESLCADITRVDDVDWQLAHSLISTTLTPIAT